MLILAVLLLLQVPPVGVLAKVVVNPWHTLAVPVIADGTVLTVVIAVFRQLPNA